MRRLLTALMAFVPAFVPACAPAAKTVSCESITWKATPVTVCEVAPGADICLHLMGEDGRPLRDFKRLRRHVEHRGDRLVLAMNAGMYHRDRSAVGLHVEDGSERHALVTTKGLGNFHMLPNGVFWVGRDGTPHVTETMAFASAAPDALHATQSGPMLVIGGALHPRFLPDSTSRKVRNGVGVSASPDGVSPDGGGTTWFAMSDAPINFHDFATLFRDELGTPDALYLDGTISRMFIANERNDAGVGMGPILSVVEN